MARKIKLSRYARPITVQGEEVYTRYSKREYQKRQEYFDNPDLGCWTPPDHLADYSYQEWIEWGGQGGRPTKWPSDKIRMRAKRAQKRLEQGQTLTQAQKELLGLIKPRPKAYKYHSDRKADPKERKARWKEKHNK